MIRVARYIYNKPEPKYDNYEPIAVISMSNTKWRLLSPFFLKDGKGRLFENIYQFQKCYPSIPKVQIKNSANEIIFDHPAEVHFINDVVQPEYYNWRTKGENCQYPIRFPVGKHNSHKCLFSIPSGPNDNINPLIRLDYVESRKKIYVKKYSALVKQTKDFLELKQMLSEGKNILIIDVDGPHQESLLYYKNKYNINDDFITNDSIEINENSINILLNDTKHPFGHGYVLAMSLLDKEIEWCK